MHYVDYFYQREQSALDFNADFARYVSKNEAFMVCTMEFCIFLLTLSLQRDDVSELAPGTFEAKGRGRKKKNQKSEETKMRERAIAGRTCSLLKEY